MHFVYIRGSVESNTDLKRFSSFPVYSATHTVTITHSLLLNILLTKVVLPKYQILELNFHHSTLTLKLSLVV